MILTYFYYLCIYKKSFNNAVLISFQSGPTLWEIWHDNPMILPFGCTVCLKIHSKVIGIFFKIKDNLLSVFIQYTGKKEREKLDGRLLINVHEMEMAFTCLYKWLHSAKQSQYGCNCQHSLHYRVRHVTAVSAVSSFHHNQ